MGPSSQAFCPEANTNPNQMCLGLGFGLWTGLKGRTAPIASTYSFLLLSPLLRLPPSLFAFGSNWGNVPHDPRLTWAAQECNMECPPAESTTGYVWSEYGWICAPGWTGTAPWRRYKSKTWWKMRKTKQEQGEPTYNPFAT